jgi:hypothetical protein
MKHTGRHPDRALTALKVNSLKDPGRYSDGNGLYLVVDPTGAKRWILRTTVKRKRCDIGLGGLRDVPLAAAREKARELRKIAKAGGDPLSVRRSQSAIPTFAQASAIVYEQNRTTWKNRKHSAQWITTLERYAFPKIGDLRVDCSDRLPLLESQRGLVTRFFLVSGHCGSSWSNSIHSRRVTPMVAHQMLLQFRERELSK